MYKTRSGYIIAAPRSLKHPLWQRNNTPYRWHHYRAHTTICNARGYRKSTPVEVHFKNGKVQKVVALKNEETVPYFARVKQFLLPLYNNLKISKAKKLTQRTDIDGCTGATFSTKAVQKNIKAAIDYYEKQK